MTELPWQQLGELGTHQGYLSNPRKVAKPTDLKIGCVATFMYLDKPRLVFVLNPSYRYVHEKKFKMHAATLELINREAVLKYLIPNLDAAQDPYNFYHTSYKGTLYNNDAYRTYLVDKISSITMFDYDPGLSVAEDAGNTVEEMQDYFKEHYGADAEKYRAQDQAVMYKLFKQGATIKEVEKYYRGVVLKRYAAKNSTSDVMKKLLEEL